MEELKAVVSERFNLSEGPFFRRLHNTLQELEVHRQAYQGGIFVGNHVHKLLKVIEYTYYNIYIERV